MSADLVGHQDENVPSSPAKKGAAPPPPTPLPPPIDPRSIIKVYNYDPDDEKNYDDLDMYGMHEITDKERKEYFRQTKESQGFDVMSFPNSFALGMITPIDDINNHADELKAFSELALKEHNEGKNTRLEFVKVVKANRSGCAGFKYFITFDVKDADAVDGRTLTYQALVWDGIEETKVLLCRPETSK